MPDLTIKPNSGSGNKVIIQDQAGAAVLTTADSGATLSNNTQDNITRLGTVASGNLSNAAIVQPAASVLKVHKFTSQNSYNVTSTTPISSGNGTTFTTLANTGAFVVHCKGRVMCYDASGDLPTGAATLYYHSSATAQGQAPTGAKIGDSNPEWVGGYSPSSNTGRWDIYTIYHHHVYVTCSGSTTYTLQVFGQMGTDCNYFHFETDQQGTITELSA